MNTFMTLITCTTYQSDTRKAFASNDMAVLEGFLLLMNLPYVLQGGLTPLHSAAHRNSTDVAEQLIKSGADVNAKDKVSTTILIYITITVCHEQDFYDSIRWLPHYDSYLSCL